MRQQSFLWANDLSTYDAIVEWSGNIPLISSMYGNHISLFTLLMAISMLISTIMTSANQPQNNSMPGMKYMMYLMPVMMIFWFNKYSSGLSYYYFVITSYSIHYTKLYELRQAAAHGAQPRVRVPSSTAPITTFARRNLHRTAPLRDALLLDAASASG